MIREGSTVEIDTLMSLIPEMTSPSLGLGSSCINKLGQSMTVLGLFTKDSLQLNQLEHPLYYSPFIN